jgi:hypothetical protein
MAERCHHVDKVQKPTNAKSDSKEEKIETARRLLHRVANDLGSSPLVEDLKQHEDILVRELTSALVDEGFLKDELDPQELRSYGNFKISPNSNNLIGEADCVVIASVGSVDKTLNAVPKLPVKDGRGIGEELEQIVELIEGDPLLDLPPLGPHRVQGEGEVVPVWLDGRGVRHSRKFYIKLIEDFLFQCKKPAATLWYTGHGQRGTGNWCFEDGAISLEDLIRLYEMCFKGRLLTIITDCSYSGHWAYQMASILDSMNIPPCGHKAIEEGYLIKVHASCQPYQRTTMCWYVDHGVEVGRGGIVEHCMQTRTPVHVCVDTKCNSHIPATDLPPPSASFRSNSHAPAQPPPIAHTICSTDSTQLRCCEEHDQMCSFALNNLSWIDVPNVHVLREYVHVIEHGNAWQYVLVHEEDERRFNALIESGRKDADFTDYGRLLCSGWGGDPPKQAIAAFFGCVA